MEKRDYDLINVKYEAIQEEISEVPYWHDLSKKKGDIDLADYSL